MKKYAIIMYLYICHIFWFSDGVTLGGKTRQHGPSENVGWDIQRQRQRTNGKPNS